MTTFTGNTVSSGSIIYASDHNTLVTAISSVVNGNIDNNNIVSGANIAGSKLADASVDLTTKASNFDGWVAVSDSWSYASATTITVPTDATTKYSVGDKIKLVQSAATKYFYVTGVAATTLTVNGGTDYTVANSAISGIYYSKAESPLGFPGVFNYTPTWVNLTVGNATQAAHFSLSGRTAKVHLTLTLGSTSSVSGSTTASLPITSASTAYNTSTVIGNAFFDGSSSNPGVVLWATTSTVLLCALNAASTYLAVATISATVPFTFGTGSKITLDFLYEVA